MSDDARLAGGLSRPSTYDALPSDNAPALLNNNPAYRIDGAIHIVYNGKLWRRTGQTQNPRVIALADAVGWNGELLSVHSDGRTILLQHHIGGIEHRIDAEQRTKWCFVTFEEVDQL